MTESIVLIEESDSSLSTNLYIDSNGFIEIEENNYDWLSHRIQLSKNQLLELKDFLNKYVVDEQ